VNLRGEAYFPGSRGTAVVDKGNLLIPGAFLDLVYDLVYNCAGEPECRCR